MVEASRGKNDLTDLFKNILWITAATDESLWADCISVVPMYVRRQFRDFARAYLKSVDFMPPPGAEYYLYPDTVESAKLRNRPRYIEILRRIEESTYQSEA